jgi:hypothetical protein
MDSTKTPARLVQSASFPRASEQSPANPTRRTSAGGAIIPHVSLEYRVLSRQAPASKGSLSCFVSRAASTDPRGPIARPRDRTRVGRGRLEACTPLTCGPALFQTRWASMIERKWPSYQLHGLYCQEFLPADDCLGMVTQNDTTTIKK